MKIETITTLQELEAVRTYWEKWQHHPNNDLDQFTMVCQLRPEIECPCVTVIEHNNQPHALLAARLERTQVVPKIGYFKAARIPARVLTVLHQGLLGRTDKEIGEVCVRHLWSLLASGEADAVVFHTLSEDSPLLRALQIHGPRWWCDKRFIWCAHWQTVLPGEQGFLVKKMKSRRRALIRKQQRDLESAFPGKVSWRWLSSFDDVPGLCAQLEKVAARTYQRGLESGFIDDEEHRKRFALFASRGQLRAQLLEIGEEVRAFSTGIIYNDTFFGSDTGFDSGLREFSPGALVMLRMVDELVREGVRKVDWGLGDAHYKQRFGDVSWREATVWMFAPTAKGMALRSMTGLSILLDSAARRMLQRAKLVDRLKKIWRQSLAKSEKNRS
jgi:CelD/BcsL family acetyltransferase involved in cellulose biosynthesis